MASEHRHAPDHRLLLRRHAGHCNSLSWLTPRPPRRTGCTSPWMPSPTQYSLSSAQMVTNPFQSLPKTYWVNSTPTPPPGRSYQKLKLLCKSLLLKEWEDAAPDPARYPYHHSLAPHAFMGLNKFTLGRLHQMRSGRSYLRVCPTWDSDVRTTCLSCDEAIETFEHAILRCPVLGVRTPRQDLQGKVTLP